MEGEHNLEKRLKTLIEANSETTRANHALEWKRRGKKVVGVVCSYIPDEMIYAADLLPYRITGTWRHPTTKADVYRPTSADLYYTHALESLLEGELDFLDGIIFTNRDDDMRRRPSVLSFLAMDTAGLPIS